LDSDCTGYVGSCIDGKESASQITINVVAEGLPCASADFPVSADFTAPTSLLTESQPGTIVEPECDDSKPYPSGGVKCLADGTWKNTFECSTTPGCQNGAAQAATEVDVTGVEAFTPEHPSCDGFNVAMGAVCHVACSNGKFAKQVYQVRCDGNQQWTVLDEATSETCIDDSLSGPPNKPDITGVDYDYDRQIVTVAFDFSNNPDDDMVHGWKVSTSHSDLGPQNKLNTIIVQPFLELSIPAGEVEYHLEEICYVVTVENSVGEASSDEFCIISTTAPPTTSDSAQSDNVACCRTQSSGGTEWADNECMLHHTEDSCLVDTVHKCGWGQTWDDNIISACSGVVVVLEETEQPPVIKVWIIPTIVCVVIFVACVCCYCCPCCCCFKKSDGDSDEETEKDVECGSRMPKAGSAGSRLANIASPKSPKGYDALQ
jgi:hypothetical protein